MKVSLLLGVLAAGTNALVANLLPTPIVQNAQDLAVLAGGVVVLVQLWRKILWPLGLILARLLRALPALEAMQRRLEQGDAEFDQLHKRDARIEQRLDAMDGRLNLIEDEVHSAAEKLGGVVRELGVQHRGAEG